MHSKFKECAIRMGILLLDYCKRYEKRPHSIAVSPDVHEVFTKMIGFQLPGYFAPYKNDKGRTFFIGMPLISVTENPDFIWML